MARNKHPEATVERILDVAQRLFLEKGYDRTTIQDIVDGLEGMTKGAVYHHFKSKEEVLDALGDKLFYEDNPFEKVKELSQLNGLEKIRWVLSSSLTKTDNRKISVQSVFLFKSPAFLKKLVDENRDILAPMFQDLIEEGVKDGSIKSESPKLLAELFTLLTNFWMMPTIFPCSEEETWQKFDMVRDISEKMGLPVFDHELTNLCKDTALRTE